MITKWRTVSRTLERWLATITRYIRDRRQIRLTQLSIDFYRGRGDSIRRRIQPGVESSCAVDSCGPSLFFFFYYRSQSCVRYVLDRNELNIERTHVMKERKKKKNVVRSKEIVWNEISVQGILHQLFDNLNLKVSPSIFHI